MRASALLRTSPYLLIESLKSRINVTKHSQRLEVAQANKMQSTLKHLGLFDNDTLEDGAALPLCYHFAYFPPQLAEAELGPDGADKTFNAGDPYTRRMWAGGRLSWNLDNPLCVGQTVEETTSLDRAESKLTRDTKTMIVVTAKKEYRNENGLALTDRRSWLFREPDNSQLIHPRKGAVLRPNDNAIGTRIGTVKASEITLFRYSALTFNSHKIQ
ncbi:Putative uncharacterized protein [Taphrina deformans PYCC 5710]|uniref:Uncharacterized protein n=1 Tax=Taphrina deformans (strain PYCC 5710 / ATCC 11124 / CBS 356.35 / IMI 108563 / JCM 9778 / NBRC 8474) TaxID=1097556 RepID=R4X8G4_TAPDE|nr:Putative uncharacterized protein [Taphrina deformans PYCC 5710]|eukprot:CCG81888.1 Putative uncharacterized protein [Taphrina deformans PYCC 5710]